MPPVSEKQRKAMYAAAEGKSNIGIPKKVGKEFTKADPGGKLPKQAPKAKGQVDRSSHFKGNPGFPSSPEAKSPPPATYQAHEAREKSVMGAGYRQHESGFHGKGHCVGHPTGSGHLRMSGHKGAHRIGKR